MIIQFVMDGPTKKTFRQIERQSDNVRKTILDTFRFMGKDLKKKISDDIRDKSTKTGRFYERRTKRGRKTRHRASAPWETHADLTGTLRRSLGWKVQGTNNLEIGYGVSGKPAPKYAQIEFGIPPHIEARPSIGNNIDGASFETFYIKRLEQLDSE
jgi:hypothetical protein